MSRTRSAILPMSIILFRSLLHSTKVNRRFLPLTTVTGPLTSLRVRFVYRLMRLLRSVVFPTPGGPTIATITGGGSSSGTRFMRGTCRRVWSRSMFRLACRSARRPEAGAKALNYQLDLCFHRKIQCMPFHWNPFVFLSSVPLPYFRPLLLIVQVDALCEFGRPWSNMKVLLLVVSRRSLARPRTSCDLGKFRMDTDALKLPIIIKLEYHIENIYQSL